MKTIKPGYLLKITTWENDADNYATTEHAGLSESDCHFLIDVANLFVSENDKGYGNGDVRVEAEGGRKGSVDLPAALEALVAAHKAKGHAVPRRFDTDLWSAEAAGYTKTYRKDYTHEVLYDFIGTWCDGEYWRVFESFEVFWVPEPIKNVTEKFI